MNSRKVIIILISVIILGGLLLFKYTYSIDEEINDDKINLILEYDMDNLSDNFYRYIDLIDDAVIPTSSYTMSSVLSENYDFLVVFAIDFILKHMDEYANEIVISDNYTYGGYSTNKYVSKDLIYEITNGVFDKKNYVIISDYLKIHDDMVPLLVIYNYDFDMKIEKILEIVDDNNNYQVSVKYHNNDLIYKYIFSLVDDRLILKNIEI